MGLSAKIFYLGKPTVGQTFTGLFIINGGRNSYDPVEILAKKLRKLNETNILVITILESQKLS